MNVVFISPNFPEHFYNFCARLKALGVNVLGIGDAPYDGLDRRCKEALNEYYYVPLLENYGDVYRAVAYFIFHYGRIDYVESQNEYWLELEAKLRDDFNIRSGFSVAALEDVKRKSKMKRHYAEAGVKTARYALVDTEENLRKFVKTVGYPIIVKPDSGVGASDTWKIDSDDVLRRFFEKKTDAQYIAEEFVPGHVETFDAIVGPNGEILFATGQVMLRNPLETLTGSGEAASYTTDVRATGLYPYGERTVRAFGVKSRFVHFEFFRLDEDRPALGKKGDILGLETNMRAPGGYIPDKMDYAYDVDVYQIWAEDLVFGENRSFKDYHFKYYTTHFGRISGVQYAHSPADVRSKYGSKLVLERISPKALSGTMGSEVFLVRSNSLDELNEQLAYVFERVDGSTWRR